uniref:Uncharacterized protein n=1 Tax=Oryza brachyantha TaxID=4533 RepID=J3MT30_ORYBR
MAGWERLGMQADSCWERPQYLKVSRCWKRRRWKPLRGSPHKFSKKKIVIRREGAIMQLCKI